MVGSSRCNLTFWIVVAVIGLLASQAATHSPTLDEVGHLPAGCLVARFGQFELYEVNPPLVKCLAAIPVVLAGPRYDWSAYSIQPGYRSEWIVGGSMIEANGFRSFWLFAMARWALLPIWVVGAVIVCRWARVSTGQTISFVASALWCVSPDVMAWSTTICPDSAAAAIGVMSVWMFRRWLEAGDSTTAAIAGVAFGMAVLTKTSWMILILLYPLLAMAHQHCRTWKSAGQLSLIGVVALYVINSGYGFDRSLQKLGDFQFFTKTLAGPNVDGTLRQRIPAQAGNRFAGTWVGEIPVPLPASFVEGLDLQKYDFEEGKWSYLRGEHKFGGWWYWYIYALLVKTPVGTIGLFFIACGWAVWRVEWRSLARSSLQWFGQLCGWTRRADALPLAEVTAERVEKAGPVLHENLILLAPAVCLFVLVSSQTGFSRYLRYVLPCYPFVFIWMSQIFPEKAGLPAWLRKVCWGLLAWSVISSLSVFPHSMSYFNELAGGPENGPAHLIDASIDWGQDVLFLADWTKEHPEAKPLYLSLHVFFDPRIAGIEYEHPPIDPRYSNQREYLTSDQIGPKPGWYSISVHQLYSRNKEFAYLFDFPKADMVGYSIYIYHLTQQDVDDWNRKHGFE
jgi:hypothetical protein